MDLNSGRAKVTIDAIRLLKEMNLDAPIIGNLTGPVSTASSLMEPTVFYKELREKREDAHAFMQFVTDDLIRFALTVGTKSPLENIRAIKKGIVEKANA